MQVTDTVLMVRPSHFRFNVQTASTNIFQNENVADETAAMIEFNNFVSLLRKNKIEVLLFDEEKNSDTPDCVFPNNWLATMDKNIFLFPMLAANRRLERRTDIVNALQEKFHFNIYSELLLFEKEEKYLEGTGALVLDRKNKIAYCNLSSRCNEEVIDKFCEATGFSAITFSANTPDGSEIYHTNVLMSIGNSVAVICDEWIRSVTEREIVLNSLKKNHAVISLSSEQVFSFAGNMLLVKNKLGKYFWILSTRAFNSLTEEQKTVLETDGKIIHADINTIESLGGGSARCMLAEIFH